MPKRCHLVAERRQCEDSSDQDPFEKSHIFLKFPGKIKTLNSTHVLSNFLGSVFIRRRVLFAAQ